MQEITLGDVTVPVYPQRWAYLANRCGKALQDVFTTGEELTFSGLPDLAGGGAYDILAALVPGLDKRMTREEWMGEETSPTVPEIRQAFRVAIAVNEIDDLPGILGKALGPAGVNLLRATALERMAAASIDSPTSPSTSGESDSTSSTPTSPTSTVNEDSPSPASAA